MVDIKSIITYNISWATQKGLILGSESKFVSKCISKYKNNLKCAENASDILVKTAIVYDTDIIGLQECIESEDGIKSTLDRFYKPLKDIPNKEYKYIESRKIKDSNGNNVFTLLIYNFDTFKEHPKCYTINSSKDINDIRPIQFVYFSYNKLLIINCHLPHQCNFEKIMNRINMIISKYYDCDRIIIIGDLNKHINSIPNEIVFTNSNYWGNKIIVKLPYYNPNQYSCCWDNYSVLGDVILDSKTGGKLLVIEEDGELASDHRPVILNYGRQPIIGGNCGICGKPGHNRRTCKTRAKSPPKVRDVPKVRDIPKVIDIPKVRDRTKTDTNGFAEIAGLIFNYRGINYSLLINNILAESSVFKLVFNGQINRIDNLIEFNKDFVITNDKIKLSDKKNMVIGIENVKSPEAFNNELDIGIKMGELNIGPEVYLGGYFNDMLQKKMLALTINTNINIRGIDRSSRIYTFLTELLDGLDNPDKNIGIIVMEPVLGGTFIDKCRNKTNIRGPQGQRCDKVCDKIKRMHENNIIHNDIHQNNLLFDEHGEPMIIDYGQSMDLSDEYNGIIEVDGHRFDIDSFIRYCYTVRSHFSNFISQFLDKVRRKDISSINNNPELSKYDAKKDYDFGIILKNISSMNETIQGLYKSNEQIIKRLSPYYIINYKGRIHTINPNSFIPYLMYLPAC